MISSHCWPVTMANHDTIDHSPKWPSKGWHWAVFTNPVQEWLVNFLKNASTEGGVYRVVHLYQVAGQSQTGRQKRRSGHKWSTSCISCFWSLSNLFFHLSQWNQTHTSTCVRTHTHTNMCIRMHTQTHAYPHTRSRTGICSKCVFVSLRTSGKKTAANILFPPLSWFSV